MISIATLKICGWSACALILCALGLGAGWLLWGQKPKMHMEAPAAAVIQPDGSMVLQRAPDPSAKPTAEVPKGSVVERIVKVYVQPKPLPAATAPGAPPSLPDTSTIGALPVVNPCPPVEVDLVLTRLPDNSRRVVTSSPNGEILPASIDIPVDPVPDPPKEVKWRVTLGYDVANHTGALGITRKVWRVDIGVLAYQVKQTMAIGAPTTSAAMITVSYSF
jgi:hypothetical protein